MRRILSELFRQLLQDVGKEMTDDNKNTSLEVNLMNFCCVNLSYQLSKK